MMRRWALLLVAVILQIAGCGPPGAPARPALSPTQASGSFGMAELTLRGPDGEAVEVPVSVAATRAQRQRGLMGQAHLPAGAGMVFLYPEPVRESYYMKDTLIALSIAFYDPEGKVVRVLDMEPCTASPCPLYDPGTAFIGALEVNQGFFRQIGLREGWVVDLPPGLPTPER